MSKATTLAEGLYHYTHGTLHRDHVVFEGAQLGNLKALLARALNTWPEAPSELFDLDQLLNHGQILTPHKQS